MYTRTALTVFLCEKFSVIHCLFSRWTWHFRPSTSVWACVWCCVYLCLIPTGGLRLRSVLTSGRVSQGNMNCVGVFVCMCVCVGGGVHICYALLNESQHTVTTTALPTSTSSEITETVLNSPGHSPLPLPVFCNAGCLALKVHTAHAVVSARLLARCALACSCKALRCQPWARSSKISTGLTRGLVPGSVAWR